ncbi:MAG: bifunctional phosphopantothenoylcysteine decarboxylase/phosphopantothenate--cysteine ligase CoaBC [Sphingobacteriales bacterium]|nr:bifunctional phosphopantothenoylcysteine decarboxylase/phosphopantothenate--cysteine ligase CoaBC [Sphingobacteriales bacterium]
MSALKDKKIIVGVCGSIAAYKTAMLVRLLVKKGAQVKVIMTDAAQTFISALTLATLSKNEVYSRFERNEGGAWNNHVDLGLWADALLIAPASANTLSKMAQGSCDNLLLATYLSARCAVLAAPAMDLDMWQHPSTQRNIDRLQKDGVQLIQPDNGELASGLQGVGRLAEPETIVQALEVFFIPPKPLPFTGKKILITAGPTYENLDPVRFIGNYSSGKMGIALADAAAAQGAKVLLVLGPTALAPTHEQVQVVRVHSAAQMLEACTRQFPDSDIAVMAAAVADYTPKEVSERKIKKGEGEGLVIELVKTADILKTLGQQKQPHQVLVGFALETHDAQANGFKKLHSKNADAIVLNSMQDSGAGFQHDTNKITILLNDHSIQEFPLKSKKEVALDILTTCAELMRQKQ